MIARRRITSVRTGFYSAGRNNDDGRPSRRHGWTGREGGPGTWDGLRDRGTGTGKGIADKRDGDDYCMVHDRQSVSCPDRLDRRVIKYTTARKSNDTSRAGGKADAIPLARCCAASRPPVA